nr:RNA-dependent RNA polymerase [Heterobasidion partitivirus 7]
MSTNPPIVEQLANPPQPEDKHVQYAKLLDIYRANPSYYNQQQLKEYTELYGFNYFVPVPETDFPPERKPSNGLFALENFRFHVLPSFTRFRDIPRTGYNPLSFITYILHRMFPQLLNILDDYCRPAGNIDAIFENFNQEVTPVEDCDPTRLIHIMTLIHFFMQIIPFSPIAFPDLRFYKWSLTTSADYHCHHSQDMKRESKSYWQYLKDHFMLEERFDYSERPRSKGFFFNSVLLASRTIIHNIKYYGTPFKPTKGQDEPSRLSKLAYWFMKYPTVLYVRSQISKISKLKIRPVYNAPFLFILLEAMVTLPLMAMCRLPGNCILWGFETIRGGMQELNRLSFDFTTFIMIDWSRFDQLAPFAIIYHFWCTFLPQLIRVDRGYMPQGEYTTSRHKSAFTAKHDNHFEHNPKYHSFATRLLTKYPPHVIMFTFVIFNILSFIWLWYAKMVFVTPDGYGFIRLLAGVPSGIFMTQILDSFVNLFLFIDGLLEFGFSLDEIRLIRLFIQGDDNIAFFIGDFERIFAFYEWFPAYALKRWHMIISVDKSSITRLRKKIEVLGYTNNNGMPSRDLKKLVATLAYPERYVTGPQWSVIQMSRAIGIAYANAAHDSSVHDLCRRAYNDARKHSGLSHDELKSIKIEYQKLGFYEIFSVNLEELQSILVQDLSQFPDYYDIRSNLRYWHGPHSVYPMWPSHFDDPLSSIQEPDDLITLHTVLSHAGVTFDRNY